MVSPDVRPLGAGELLDRAITLFVRHFWAIVLVLGVVTVPVVALTVVASGGQSNTFGDLASMIGARTASDRTAALSRIMAHQRAFGGGLAAAVVVQQVAYGFMWLAVLGVLAAAYAGRALDAARAYGLALRRAVPLLAVTLVYVAFGVVVGIVGYIALIIVGVLGGLATAALWAVLHALGIVAGIIFGLIFIAGALAFVAALAWLLLAWNVAVVALVTETANPAQAIGTGMRRLWSRGMRVRGFVAALIIVALSLFAGLPFTAVAGLVGVLAHSDVPAIAVGAAGRVLVQGLTAAFVVVFAIDARVRREGVDLLASLDAPAATT